MLFKKPTIFLKKQARCNIHETSGLEELADLAIKRRKAEFKKLNLKPGDGFTQHNRSTELKIAENDLRCRRISVYLFSHSLELLLKGIYVKINCKEPPYKHTITEIYKEVKNNIIIDRFNLNELHELFSKLDELLIWAGRYPAPKQKNTNESRKRKTNLAKIKWENNYTCYSGDFVISIDRVVDSGGIKLMKNFITHLLNEYSPFSNTFAI